MTASNTIDKAAAKADSTVKEVEISLREVIERLEKAVQDGLELFRAQTKTYASTAGEQIDVAQRYVVERVQERPMTATVAALGAGVLIGLLLAGGRDR